MAIPARCECCPAVDGCVFADLPEASFERFHDLVSLRTEPAKRIVLRQGERPPGVFLVRSGLVRMLRLERGGRMADLGFVPPGSLLGLTEVVTGARAALSAETYSTSELEYAPRGGFVPLLLDTPELAVQLLIQVSAEVERLRDRIGDAATNAVPAGERLFAILDELGSACGVPLPGGQVRIRVTVEELALRLGLTRQWTSGLLQGLIAGGRIRRSGRWLVLPSSDHGAR